MKRYEYDLQTNGRAAPPSPATETAADDQYREWGVPGIWGSSLGGLTTEADRESVGPVETR